MYCGKDLTGDSSNGIEGSFEREHTVEWRENNSLNDNQNILKHCKFNFSITCSKCNQLKRGRDSKNIPHNIQLYYQNCLKQNCKSNCDVIKNILETYSNSNSIIIQPEGVIEKSPMITQSLGVTKSSHLKIEYSVLEKVFIDNHIKLFELNSRKLKILYKVVEELYNDLANDFKFVKLNKKSIFNIDINSYQNILDDIFIDYFNSLTLTQKRMIIKLIYSQYLL